MKKRASQFIELGLRTLNIELQAIEDLRASFDDQFALACQLMLRCKGRIIVAGMGKSGHIARKIAATLASTGTPSFFVHAAEAGHGDMGMITPKDLVLMISHSGKTQELVQLIPLVRRLGIPLLAMSGNPNSTLAKEADIHLLIKIDQEACPLDLAPTSSTTATLVMGDALAIALLEARGFTADEFAFSHPSGSLGKKLLLRVNDIMHSGDALPRVKEEVNLSAALIEMTEKKLGMTTILTKDGKLSGIFTDGDLRRWLDRGINVHKTKMKEVMTTEFHLIRNSALASEALELMQRNKINALPVIDDQGELVGAFNMHDLLKAGIF